MHEHGFHIYGVGAFFLLGLAGSLHCIGMCGPVSALWIGSASKKNRSLALYHAGRLFSYLAVGSLFYRFGSWVNPLFHSSLLFGLLLGVLGMILFGVRIPMPSFIVRLESRLLKKTPASRGWMKAAILGVFTPLIPCGLLYSAFAGALMAPSWGAVLAWMGAFTLGTMPLLVLGQSGTLFGLRRIQPRFQALASQILAGVSLASLVLFKALHH